jgi:YD repeat-containing protein
MQASEEHLWIDYTDKRFAYTLYNYDLAGNLIKTVPPMGVQPLDSASIVPIDAMRASNTFNVAQLPNHKKTSRYEYNTANQLVREHTPDGGEKLMYYDAKGNLILSQNDKQRPRGLYTYCLYDAQNRIIETGEVNWMNCVYFADVPLYDANRNLTTPPNACAIIAVKAHRLLPDQSIILNMHATTSLGRHLGHAVLLIPLRTGFYIYDERGAFWFQGKFETYHKELIITIVMKHTLLRGEYFRQYGMQVAY